MVLNAMKCYKEKYNERIESGRHSSNEGHSDMVTFRKKFECSIAYTYGEEDFSGKGNQYSQDSTDFFLMITFTQLFMSSA